MSTAATTPVATDDAPVPSRPRAGEAGFMLIELLVASMLMLVILGAVLTVLGTTTRISAEDRERTLAIREAEAQLGALVREARHAYRVNAGTASRLDVDVHAQGRTRRLVFDCGVAHPTLPGLTRCTRQEVQANGTLTAPRVLVDRVASPSVFAYTSQGGVVSYVRATLRVPGAGERRTGPEHRIVLDDGFALRNAGAVA